jgi:hypothetical protein
VVVIVVKLRQRRFGGSWSANLAAGPATIFMFRSGFFIVFVHPLQLVGYNGGNAANIVIIA